MKFVFVHRVVKDGRVHRDPEFEAEDSAAAMAQVVRWMVTSQLSAEPGELDVGEMMGVERIE